MICEHCAVKAPEGLKTISKTWVCPICLEKPFENFVPLTAVLTDIYSQPNPSRVLYVSDLEGNLDRAKKHFNECENINSSLTLVYPTGVYALHGQYDAAFFDADINGIPALMDHIDLKPEAIIILVEPSKQVVQKA